MIPKEFYKGRMPLYTEDFDTEIYSAIKQSNSYRIDIRYDENFNNYIYFFKTSFPQLFYPLMTRQFFCDFHEKSEDFCVS